MRAHVRAMLAVLSVIAAVQVVHAPTAAAGSRHEPDTIVVGALVGAVVKSDGTVWTWGNGASGALGNGTTTNPQLTEVRVEVAAGVPLDSVTEIAGGYGHMCALRSNGEVWCWGDNGEGRLGDGTTTGRTRPVRVETAAGVPLTNAIQIQTGLDYSAALLADGTVWSWGRNTDGQLGDGTLTNQPRPVRATYLADGTPVQDVVSLGGGWAHATVVRGDGTVWAWGANADGQLGDGSLTRRTGAVRSQLSGGGALTDVVEVSTIGHFTAALRGDGSVWTWGDNTYGQLSDGSTTDRTGAVAAVTASGAAVRARNIQGAQYNLYWVQQDGTVYAAGYGGWSSIGDGGITSRTRAVQVTDTTTGVLTGVHRVAGTQSAMALKADGTLWSWGYNPDGRSGTGATGDVPRATQISYSRGSGWTSVAAGASHTVALRANGSVWAWGDNASGQLGIGATGAGVDGPPLQVTMAGGGPLDRVVAVAAGSDHSLALRADGSVWAWGAGAAGQLGDGTTTAAATRAVQVTVAGGAALGGAKSIAAGGDSSLAIRSDGTAVSWGAGTGGQLASGALADRTRADAVLGPGSTALANLHALDAGRSAGLDGFSLFAEADGDAWASGDGDLGQLGDGGTARQSLAVRVMDGSGSPFTRVADVAAGGAFGLARRTDGTVWAWGSNASGQLGDGTTSSRGVPQPVTLAGGGNLTLAAELDAGVDHGVAGRAGGGVRAWGSAAVGQLGDGTTTTRTAAVSTVRAAGGAFAAEMVTAGTHHLAMVATDAAAAFVVLTTGRDATGQLGDCGRGGTSLALVQLAMTCPAPVNDGSGADVDGQTSTTTVTANWNGHVDQTLVRYDYCVATSTNASGCAGTILVGWTSNGTSTAVSHGGLALAVNSTYYVCARLVRATTLDPVCSDGVKVDDSPPSVPTLVSPADGASVAVADLTASYVDTYTSGVVEFQACADATCATVQATAQSQLVASGTNGTARVALPRGTWYWRARAIDAAGLSSAWSAAWSFTYNAIPTATAVSPDSGVWVATRQPSLAVRHDDPDGDPGTITAELCSTSATDPWATNCTTGYQASATGQLAVAAGTNATLAPNTPLADGTWYWRARTVDAANAASTWTGIRSINVDATAPAPLPVVTLTRKGAGRIDVSWTASTDGGVGGVRYEVQRYATGTSSWSTVCTTTSLSCTQTGLGGSEILVVRVRACDSLGNCSDWSGASAVANSGYLLRNTASANLNNVQSRVAVLPPAGTLDSTTTGVRLPAGNSAGRVGAFPFRYNNVVAAAITPDTTAPIDPQDTVNGWGWVIDDVDAKAVSAGGMEAVVTTEATAGSGGGVGRVLCRVWRAQTNGTTSLVSWQHLADAYGNNSDVMTASTAGPVTSTCDLSSALSTQLTFATNEVLYVELLLDATVAGSSGDQYMLRFNDASTAINMPIPGTPPSVPTLVSPIAGALTGTTPSLVAGYSHPTATDGVLEVQFSTDATFATGVTSVTSTPLASGSTGSVSPGTLAGGQTWYWRARARDTAGLASLWSAGESFRTTTAPSAPVPSSPADGAGLEAGSVVLVAGAFADADLPSDSHAASQWQVAPAGGDWSSPTADSGATATDLTSWATPALGTGTWQWRVRYRDQYGAWSAWSSVANPRTVVLTAASSTISLSTPSLGLGAAVPGSDLTGSVTAAVSTTNATGYTLAVTDGSDTAALSCACGGSIADWTGTDATPTAWTAGLGGYGGLTVRDAPGGRMAKWGTGTGTTEGDHVSNHYAGLRSTSSTQLHRTSAVSTAANVVTTVRVNGAATTPAGAYSTTLLYSIVANP